MLQCLSIIYGISGGITPFNGQSPPRAVAIVIAARKGRIAGRSGRRRKGKLQIVSDRLKRTVVLVGMMGAGKTAVGSALARMLGVRFVDSDDEIERAAGMSIPEIFARDGETFFRLKEAQVIGRLLAGPPCILSTGGGAFITPETRDEIARRGVSVWLSADPALLWARVKGKSTRPLLKTENPRARLEALCSDRAPVYALADIRVDGHATLAIDDMARRVMQALSDHGGVLAE